MDYQTFLSGKHLRMDKCGFDVPAESLNKHLFPFQRAIVRWALQCGRAALFESMGLGKTIQQLEWANQVVNRTSGKVLLLCPLAVQWQTKQEAARFGIEGVNIAETNDEVHDGITITNYDKLHLFKPEQFTGVVLDEASVLKNFTGVTKRRLCDWFSDTPYRLACTATPSPNDRMELGNQSEFLGVMPSNEMLCRWFINDGSKVGLYRLRKHGAEDFWRWVASWAVCIGTPADIGFDATGYDLPPLNMHEHVIDCKPQDGFLFAVPKDISATEVHKEKRAYLDERAEVVAELANSDRESWAVWCDTDYEADALTSRIPDAVEVRGSHSAKEKESRLRSFSDGTARVIVTKAEIGGFGLNWQHCHNTTWFAGYSFEKFVQAIGRLHRFGQTKQVNVHVVRTVSEGSIVETVQRKQEQHVEMHREMSKLMAAGMQEELGLTRKPRKYEPTTQINLPSWMSNKGVTA